MNRYKFRAWLKNEKKMVEVEEINFTHKEVRFKDYKTPFMKPIEVNVLFDEIELMLGLEIYDETIFIGDVVRVYGGEYMYGYYEVDKTIHINDLEDLVSLSNMNFGIDILGNIYENKELLKDGTYR